MTEKGKLIAIEGIDGAGKTTLIESCVDCLLERGKKAVRFKNASGGTSPLWQTILSSKKIMSSTTSPMPSLVDQALHTFEFVEHCTYILPSLLEDNDYVFSDRYVVGRQILSLMEIGDHDSWPNQYLSEMICNGTVPPADLSIYLQLPPYIAKQRILKRGTEIEPKESNAKLQSAHSLFDHFICDPSVPLIVMNAEQSIAQLTHEVLQHLNIPGYTHSFQPALELESR